MRCAPPDLEPLAVAAERTHSTSRSPRRARSHACLAAERNNPHNLRSQACSARAEQTARSSAGAAPFAASLTMAMRVGLVLLLAQCAARPAPPRRLTLKGGAKKKAIKHGFRHRIHPIHLGITGYAGYVALKELNEELYDLGHHHGLAMLVASRLCRTLATIEDKAMHELPSLKKMLVAQTTMHILCAGAVVAAGWEVYNDLKPGGHHGMVLLAIHEVHELLEEADWDPKHHKALHSATLKFVIAGGALACAVAELVEDLVPGAHHGVALLAASHVWSSIGLIRAARKARS